MSKILFFPCLLVLLVSSLLAQTSPQGFKYQAVVQADGGIVTGAVGARFTIREGSTDGSIVYREIQFPTANNNGVIAVTIGPEGDGIAAEGSFQAINWGDATLFLQTEIDPDGATDYINMGTSQIMSVPYAMYSDRAGEAITASTVLDENQTLNLSGNNLSISSGNSVALPWILSGSNVYRSGGNVGIGTSSPGAKLTVRSTILSENSAGDQRARIYVQNDDTGRMEVYGHNDQWNVVIGAREGLPNFGYVGVANPDGSLEAAMLIDDFGNGLLVADEKNFVMPHPEQPDKNIWYACIEGPEAAAYERGTGELINGEAYIPFSDTYQIVANPTTMTVILTPLSATSKGMAVIEKTENGFRVKELNEGTGNYRFDWEVKCVRKGHESFQVIRDSSWGQPAKPNE